MNEFTIKEISNGWLLAGLEDKNFPAAGEATLFLPNLTALSSALIMWQTNGLKAAMDLDCVP